MFARSTASLPAAARRLCLAVVLRTLAGQVAGVVAVLPLWRMPGEAGVAVLAATGLGLLLPFALALAPETLPGGPIAPAMALRRRAAVLALCAGLTGAGLFAGWWSA
jgi:hypothetical protein